MSKQIALTSSASTARGHATANRRKFDKKLLRQLFVCSTQTTSQAYTALRKGVPLRGVSLNNPPANPDYSNEGKAVYVQHRASSKRQDRAHG